MYCSSHNLVVDWDREVLSLFKIRVSTDLLIAFNVRSPKSPCSSNHTVERNSGGADSFN